MQRPEATTQTHRVDPGQKRRIAIIRSLIRHLKSAERRLIKVQAFEPSDVWGKEMEELLAEADEVLDSLAGHMSQTTQGS